MDMKIFWFEEMYKLQFINRIVFLVRSLHDIQQLDYYI